MKRLCVSAALPFVFAICGCDHSASARVEKPTATNPPSIGIIDFPKNGSRVGRSTAILGWALDERGVREVRVYVEDGLAGRFTPDQPRPDVSATFPGLAAGSDVHGWQGEIDFGSHEGATGVRLDVVDTAGAVTTVSHVTFQVER